MLVIGPQRGMQLQVRCWHRRGIVSRSCMLGHAEYLTPEYGKHPRAHNVRPYGLYRVKLIVLS